MSCRCGDFRLVPSSYGEILDRCREAAAIEASLCVVSTSGDGWLSIHECSVCGQLWAREWPFSAEHGGGPPCYYWLPPSDPASWLQKEPAIASRLREQHEEAAFVEDLGPEIGPGQCRVPGCSHMTVSLSVFCAAHHAERISRVYRRRTAPSCR